MQRLLLSLLLIHAFVGHAQQAPATPAHPSASAADQDNKPPAELAEAEEAMTKSDWKAAEFRLDPYLKGHPSDAQALFDRGYVADAQNQSSEAKTYYRRAIEANPNSYEAHLSLGLLLARQGKPEAARPELVAATELDPGDAGAASKARAWRALAQIDRPHPNQPDHPGDPTEASNDLLEALKLSPETTADTLLAASLADEAGDVDRAEKAYRRVLAAEPQSAPANAGLAHILIAHKQFPEAESLLREALKVAPGDTAMTAQLAVVLAAEDKAEALPMLRQLHQAHPDDASLTRMLATVLADAGDYAGSDQLYVSLLATAPNDGALLVGHGQNLIRRLDYAGAFAAFNKATEADPSNAEAWSGLAFAAARTSQPEITLHALTMRSKYLPDVASTYFLWATSYDSLHKKTEAAAYYERFLELAAGKFPDQEWQARQRMKILGGKP